ncbi:MAG: hypothetical protein K6G50_10130 [bacterium]|nr:hypothetical protein [bacterium]
MRLRLLGISLAVLLCGMCADRCLAAQELDSCLAAVQVPQSSGESVSSGKSGTSSLSDEERAKQHQKNKEKKNKRNIKPAESGKSDKDGNIDFVRSETGYWNARVVSDPAFGSSGESVNSVMFQSRPGRNIRNVEFGKGKPSEIEINGGKPTEVIINGKKVNSPKELKPGEKLEKKP